MTFPVPTSSRREYHERSASEWTPGGRELTPLDRYRQAFRILFAQETTFILLSLSGFRTRADLVPIIGSRARVFEVLNRRRELSIAMIARIRAKLGISADTLIGRQRAA